MAVNAGYRAGHIFPANILAGFGAAK